MSAKSPVESAASKFIIKICGVTRGEDARLAASLGADYVGLIRAESPRRVSLEAAQLIRRGLPRSTEAVLLYRNQPVADVIRELRAGGFRMAQLHGQEPLADLAALGRELPGVGVIRAWELGSASDVVALGNYLRLAIAQGCPPMAVILDIPKGRSSADESLFEQASAEVRRFGVPVWRAGGLTAETVRPAISGGLFDGVDVARGVESGPGIKDAQRLRDFVAAVRDKLR